MAKKKGDSKKYREIIEETLYEYRTGKLLTHNGEPINDDKEALSVAMERAKAYED